MVEQHWYIRRIFDDDLQVVVDILREASVWRSGRFGEPLWPPESLTIDEQKKFTSQGEQVGGFERHSVVACMRLQRSDPLYWPEDRDGTALYIHKLAIRREVAGKGWPSRMIQWAIGECRKASVSALRLDTLAQSKLPTLYEGLGFRIVDTVPNPISDALMVRMESPIDGGHETLSR